MAQSWKHFPLPIYLEVVATYADLLIMRDKKKNVLRYFIQTGS